MLDQSKSYVRKPLLRKAVWMWLGCLWLISNASFAQPDIPLAIDYLKSQQNSVGSISHDQDIATSFQSTAEALRAFSFVDEEDAAVIQPANDFINNEGYRNTENLSRLLHAANISGVGALPLVSLLSEHQNSDGGFGEFKNYDSTVIDTAMALEALALSGLANDQTVGLAVDFLLNQQLAEGGWLDGSNEASIYKSALAMRALWHYRGTFSGVSDSLSRVQNYFYQQQDSLGLWGETFQSALVLIAIVPNTSEYSMVEGLIASLAEQQQADGSWDGSPYITALVLRALRSQATPLPTLPTEGGIVGRVLDAETQQPVANAVIQIDGGVTANSNGIGGFELSPLTAGRYDISITATGYGAVTVSNINVKAGSASNVGNVLLSASPDTGILQGLVTNSSSGQALAGVSISISGATTANTVSQSDGRFSLVGLTPGNIMITVVSAGYLPITANSTITAGRSLVFNPAMVKVATGSGALPGVPDTGLLRGVVTDASTGLPIQSAYIRLSGSATRGAYSAADGVYVFADLTAGNINIDVAKSGYYAVAVSGQIAAGNATIFNVALVPEGNDPNSGSSDTETEPLPGVPTTGLISGVVRNAEDDLPLAGVEVVLTGSFSATTQTAIDGSYSIADVTPGDVQLAVSLQGFIPVSANGTVVAGNSIDFSPKLLPEGNTVDLPASIIGQVNDASSGQGLRNVLIFIEDSVDEFETNTDSTGRFSYSVAPAGNYTVSVSKYGYVTQSFSVVLAGGSTLDFQTIQLKRVISEVAVYGVVIDGETGEPINGASVGVLGSQVNGQTDAQGRYRINGVGIGTRTLIFSATGYASQTLIYDFPEGGEYEMDRQLRISGSGGLKLTAMMLDQAEYSAYTDTNIQVSVLNESAVPMQASVEFTLYDENDVAIALFAATFEDANGETQTLFTFDSTVVRDIPVIWNTRSIPPGSYRLVSRLIAGNVFVGPAKVVLAERVSDISILSTKRIELFSLSALPEFSAVGVTDEFLLLAEIVNRSNVGIDFSVKVELLSPSGEILYQDTPAFYVAPDQENLSIQLEDEVEITFAEAGEHMFKVTRQSPHVTEAKSSTVIAVAPGIRIDAIQSLAPTNVTPDGDKRIRMRVRLEGRELQ